MAKYLYVLISDLGITAGRLYEIERDLPDQYVVYDDDDDEHAFRKSEEGNWFTTNTAVVLEKTRTQLATLTAEIAQLEAHLAEESRLKVGDYARVTDTESVDNFALDEVVRITRCDDTQYPLRGECPISEVSEWFSPAALTKITPAEARASLIAKIDAHFGGQEAK